MELFKKLGAVAVALVMAAATILPMASVDVSADTATTPTAIEDVDFNYAYDVQRDPAYPVKDDTVTMSSLQNPVSGETEGVITRYDSSNGKWELEVAGKYSNITNPSQGLVSIVNKMQTEYGAASADDFIIHKLLKDANLVAYGMVVAYDPDKGMAIFLGDSLERSAGYLLTTTNQSGNNQVTMKATQIATDISQNTPTDPPADNNTTTPTEKPVEPAKDKTPDTGDNSNAAGLMALVLLSGAALAGFGVNRKFNAN